MQEKRAARQEAKATELKLNLPTFEECAEIYIRERWLTWSKKHRDQWPSSLKRDAYATIGKLTIPEIKPSHTYELLRPIWVEKRETANRVRGRIETIIAKNINVDDTDFRNPAELTKQLREKLPRRPKRVVRHHPALPYAEAPHFMANLSAAGGIAARQFNLRSDTRPNRDASQSNRSTITSSADWKRKRFGAAALHPLEMINHVLKRGTPPKSQAEIAKCILQKSRALGLYAMDMPEDVGGGGLSNVDMCLVEEQFAGPRTCSSGGLLVLYLRRC